MTPAEWRRKAAWLHSFRTCCLSGRQEIELSHLHEGSFMLGRKVSDVLVLPMCHLLHKAQHRHADFWRNALPGENPKDWAVRLDEVWQEGDMEGAADLFADMQGRANRSYLAQFLEARE